MVSKKLNDGAQQQVGPEDGGDEEDERPGSGRERYTVPLPDRDPLNRMFLRSPAYEQLLERCGGRVEQGRANAVCVM